MKALHIDDLTKTSREIDAMVISEFFLTSSYPFTTNVRGKFSYPILLVDVKLLR